MNLPVGKFISFAKGKPPKETFEVPSSGMLPYLSPEYLRGESTPLWVNPTANSVHVYEGETIILWDGSNAGEIFRAKRGVLGSTMAVVRPLDSDRDSNYFGFALKLHEERLRGFTAGSGIPHVDKSIVKRLPFRKHTLVEQQAIATLLGIVNTHILETNGSISAAEKLQRGLMSELLSGRMRPNGEKRSAQEFTQHPKLGSVPVGWKIEPL